MIKYLYTLVFIFSWDFVRCQDSCFLIEDRNLILLDGNLVNRHTDYFKMKNIEAVSTNGMFLCRDFEKYGYTLFIDTADSKHVIATKIEGYFNFTNNTDTSFFLKPMGYSYDNMNLSFQDGLVKLKPNESIRISYMVRNPINWSIDGGLFRDIEFVKDTSKVMQFLKNSEANYYTSNTISLEVGSRGNFTFIPYSVFFQIPVKNISTIKFH